MVVAAFVVGVIAAVGLGIVLVRKATTQAQRDAAKKVEVASVKAAVVEKLTPKA